MSTDPKNDDETSTNEVEEASVPKANQSSIGKTPETPASDDPLDLKKSASGIGVLILVCAVLYGISKFGPEGSDWIAAQARNVFGVEKSEEVAAESPVEAESTDPVDKDAESVIKEPIKVAAPKEVASKPVAPMVPSELKLTGDPKIDNAKKQISEALGGPGKVDVRHVAISKNGSAMIAAVRLITDGVAGEMLEIPFEQDDFGRFVTTEDSPIDQEIKIWDK